MLYKDIAKVDLLQHCVMYPGSIVVQAWTTGYRLVIVQENKQAKEAIQSYRTSVAMHSTAVEQPRTTGSPNSKPTMLMFQAAVGFISKHTAVHVHRKRTIGDVNACGFQSRVNEAMDNLSTFHSAENGV
ncbi:hypothetical protein TNCV_1638991 [Trichonephila clavipes]|nr:hypothetical protein TNCV_1638991 [Trichonephila clavipes]